MIKKSHDPAPERAHEIEEELHHLDEVEASLRPSEPAPPAPEGADMAPLPGRPPPTQPIPINELMAGWWKEAQQLTLHPDGAGDHFAAYAAARGWTLTEAPAPQPTDTD